MLVLTRKKDQSIQVGENITITVLKLKGRSVQLGIEAPEGIQILRAELVDQPESARATGPSNQARAAGTSNGKGAASAGTPPSTVEQKSRDPIPEATGRGRSKLRPEKLPAQAAAGCCHLPASRFGRPSVRVRAIVVHG